MSLRSVQREFARINQQLSPPRDPIGDDVVQNMIAGYELVDALVAGGINLFAMGNLKYLLELNTTVLCGTDPMKREADRLRADIQRQLLRSASDGPPDSAASDPGAAR